MFKIPPSDRQSRIMWKWKGLFLPMVFYHWGIVEIHPSSARQINERRWKYNLLDANNPQLKKNTSLSRFWIYVNVFVWLCVKCSISVMFWLWNDFSFLTTCVIILSYLWDFNFIDKLFHTCWMIVKHLLCIPAVVLDLVFVCAGRCYKAVYLVVMM